MYTANDFVQRIESFVYPVCEGPLENFGCSDMTGWWMEGA